MLTALQLAESLLESQPGEAWAQEAHRLISRYYKKGTPALVRGDRGTLQCVVTFNDGTEYAVENLDDAIRLCGLEDPAGSGADGERSQQHLSDFQ